MVNGSLTNFLTLKFRNFYVEILDVKCLKKVLEVPKDPQNFTNWHLNTVGALWHRSCTSELNCTIDFTIVRSL